MRILLLLTFLFFFSAAFAKDDPQNGHSRTFKLARGVTEKDYLPNTIIIKFRKGTTSLQINSSTSAIGSNRLIKQSASLIDVNQLFKASLRAVRSPVVESRDTIGLDRIFTLEFTKDGGIENVINEVLQNPIIEYAEPSYIYHTNYAPNDFYYSGERQNYLRQIKADMAWDLVLNSSNVVIGIVDSGSDLDHEDLKANIVLPGKDLVGPSFSNLQEDNDPDVKSDSTDHGVRVSGMASAVSNNGLGIASVASNAKLLIVKVGADNNSTTIYRGYEGIKYAADNGARIINCSWSGPGGGGYGEDIINYALSKGCLVIAAAGNENSNIQEFPALYPGVMAVASVDYQDKKSSFSNYGSHIAISAPGEIFTTANGNKYVSVSGTSFSAPLVASAAALVSARFPAYDMNQVREQLRVTADNIDAINSNYAGLLGKGRLNVFRAVSESSPSIRNQKITLVDKGKGSIPPGDTLRLFFDLKNFLSAANGLIVRLSSSNPDILILDAQLTAGNVGTGELKTMVGPFRVYIKPGIADNEDVDFKLSYSANATYTDFELFRIKVALDYLNIEVNRISTTISSNGRIGYSGPDASNGLGFIYKGEPLLYEASLMIGNGPARVSNNARNDMGSSDEHFDKIVRVGKIDDRKAAFLARSEFNDAGSLNRLDLHIKHSQTAFDTAPDDKYTIAEYDIQNTGSTLLTGVYIGLFVDLDADPSGHDITKYDAANRMGYVFGKAGDTLYGAVKLLNKDVAPAYYPMSDQIVGDPLQNGGGFSIAEKYQSLSSGIKATGLGENDPNGIDVMFTIGYGPYTIPAKASTKVAFAFIGGDNLADIQSSALAAQNKYNQLGQTNPLAAEGFVLGQNYPNPGSDNTVINFTIAETASTTLNLYDIIGHSVKELVNANLQKGSYSINVDLSELESGIYIYKMKYKGKEKSLKLIVGK